MAKFLKAIGFSFLALLLLVNLLLVMLVFFPSDRALSFALKEGGTFIHQDDLPAHSIEAFSFLSQASDRIQIARPSSDMIARNWMANVLFAREKNWQKPEDHLTFYLNTLDFGDEVIGIQQASMYYFGKSSTSLSQSEAISLASLYRSLWGKD